MKSSFFILTCFSFILLALPFTGMNAQRQAGNGRLKEKLKASHAAYITQELELTETEAQKFWPVYNAYRSEIEGLRFDADRKSVETMTDKEAEDLLNEQLETKAKEVEVQKKYVLKLKTVIPARKILLLWKAEKEYREKVISNLKNRRRNE
jgi:hypothetical protein